MGLTFQGRKDRLSLSENYSNVQLIRKQQVETQRQGGGVAALEVGGSKHCPGARWHMIGNQDSKKLVML